MIHSLMYQKSSLSAWDEHLQSTNRIGNMEINKIICHVCRLDKIKKIRVKHRLQWWCKVVVDFPSLNDWAEDGGWGVINPWLVVTRQAKKRCSGGRARTPLLWLVLGCGTNFQRASAFFFSTPPHWLVSTEEMSLHFAVDLSNGANIH